MGFFDTIGKIGNKILDFASPITSLIGIGADILGRNSDKQNQQEFAQQGLRWKVEDAKAAGLHPLAALGTPTTPFQPAYGGMASDFASMGQDTSRAINATRTGKERTDAKLLAISIERGELENELLRSQIAKTNQVGPPMPFSNAHLGDEQGKYFNENPAQITHTQPGKIGQEAGAITSYGFGRNADGSLSPVPSTDMKQRIEDQIIPELLWSVRNNLAPNFGGGPSKPPFSFLPKGQGYIDWEWSYKKQAFVPVKHLGRKAPSLYELFIKSTPEQRGYIKHQNLLKTPRH